MLMMNHHSKSNAKRFETGKTGGQFGDLFADSTSNRANKVGADTPRMAAARG